MKTGNRSNTGMSPSPRNSQRLTRRILATTFLLSVALGILALINLSLNKDITAAVTGDYRTVASGNWNSPATWEMYDGSNWIPAVASPTSANGTISIRGGHTVTVTTTISVDQVMVDSDGFLITNSGTLTFSNGSGSDLIVNGTATFNSQVNISGNGNILVNKNASCESGGTLSFAGGSTITINSNATFTKNGGTVTTNAGKWTINNGGTYKQNDQTAIPLATWNSGSTCEITGVTTTLPGNINQSYSNFKWNCPFQTAAINFGGSFQDVGGDLTIVSTGTSFIQLDQQGNNTTIDIGGNFIVQGGVIYGCMNGGIDVNVGIDYIQTGGLLAFNLSGGTAYGNNSMVMTVAGNILVSGGTLDLSQCSANNSAKGNGTIILEGNMNLSGTGLLTETSAQSRGQVYFDGSTVQYFTSDNSVTRFIDFTVNSGAILRMDNQVMTGWGKFTLQNGAGLMTGHPDGITKTSASGNIQVTDIRTYNTGADYTYNGLELQSTGDGLPSQVRNLTFNNSSNVSLSNSSSVSGTLFFTSGLCIASNDTLTLGISTGTRGTLNRTVGHVVGYFRRWLNSSTTTNTLFPVGTLNYYNPAYFSFTNSPSAGSIVCRFVPTNPGTLGLPFIDAGLTCYTMGYGYWALGGMNGFSGGVYTVKVVAEGFPGITDYTQLHLLRRVGTGSPWTTNGTHATGTGSNSLPEANRTGMNLLGHYGISSNDLNPLPIQLISFDAKANSEYVDLSWTTASEVNNDYFTVERSSDGKNFKKLLTKKGSGTSSELNNYSVTDLNPLPGYSYYQLRQTDFDGTYTISNIVSVYFNKNKKDDNGLKIISVSNFTTNFNLKYNAKPNSVVRILLMNSTGQVVYETSNTSPDNLNTFEYNDEKNLPAGVYFIQIMNDGQKCLQKIIKNN